MLNASVELTNFDKEFEKNIIKEINKKIASVMQTVTQSIKEKLKIELIQAIGSSPTWVAVKSDILRGELGIANVSSLDNILEVWGDGIQVSYIPGVKTLGVIKIGMIASDYSDVLSLPESTIIAVGKRNGSVELLEWLRWLLLESTQVIIADYDFYPKSGAGRTGLGIMVKSGGGWQVPPQYAGSATDNFATRSLQDIKDVIDRVVLNEINRSF